jgi:hypothetical protein
MDKNRRNFLKFLVIGTGGFVFYKVFGSKIFGSSALAAAPNPGHSISQIEPGTEGQSLITSSGVTTWGSARYS